MSVPASVGLEAAIAERMRRLIGGGQLEEIVVTDDEDLRHLDAIVACARLAGRSVCMPASVPPSLLPPATGRERWIRRSTGAQGWRLQAAQPAAWRLAIKRVVDIAIAGILSILLSPALLALALAVRLSSPGPVLYRWRVLGRYGRPFTGYKFRTMIADADQRLSELLPRNEMRGPVFKLQRDPRVTRLGRWLRRYSLDELPQLWNVVRGHMSLVGPRPPFRHEYEQFELWQMRKLSVKPGVTCLWQVGGRNRIAHFAEWARLDLQYIDEWSLRADFKILVRTIAAVVRGTGR